MKKQIAVLRILCALIDAVIILLPVQFIMMGIFQVSNQQAELLYKLLFAVYGVLLTEYTQGRTLGKMIGKIKIIDHDSDCQKKGMMYIGIRELTKSLYLVPVFGWALCLISIVLLFLKGRAIHDYTGGTRVITITQEKHFKKENLYE